MLCGISCRSFNCSIGIGYRKIPESMPEPILPRLLSMKPMGLSPAQIELIMKFLSGDNLKVLFPENSRVDLGLWIEVSTDNESL